MAKPRLADVAGSLGGQRHIHLDMLRGLAALAVVVGHIRGFLLVDFGEIAPTARAVWHQSFYFAGGLGHQSVIAFFALSGFLVGGKALGDMLAGTWSWGHYMVARLARLWTVVVPALLLTLACDVAGRMLGGGAGYDGRLFGILSSGPQPDTPVDHAVSTLVANVLFLQTIAAPVYGSNGPLWSLANEFWYYIVFPLLAAAVLIPGKPVLRVVSAAAGLALAWLLPTGLMLLGAIWVAGAIAKHLTDKAGWRRLFAHPVYAVAVGIAVAGAVAAGFRWHGAGYDLALGFVWAAALPAVAMLPPLGGLYARIAHALSEISYTLYATHFPLLALIYFTAIAPRQWTPGLEVIGLGCAMLVVAIVLAAALWWCFERNTGVVRAFAVGLLPKR